MTDIKPFKALRPAPQYAKRVASRPYDVLNSKEAKAEAEGVPESFLHITKSEIDLPASTDIHSREVYEKAKENLTAFVGRGILFQENKPCFYLYELTMEGHTQTGLVCVSSLKDYRDGSIKKHEFTRPDKELDRINHIKTTGAQTGNVFLAYKNVEELDKLVEGWKSSKNPLYDITSDDGIVHKIWIINDDKVIMTIQSIFDEQVENTYIADGHHRAASAGKVYNEFQDSEKYFLTTLFPANQLKILDYNRVVKDLNGLSAAEFLNRLQEIGTLEVSEEEVKPSRPGEFGIYTDGKWYRLRLEKHSNGDDPIASLDITALQEKILAPVLNITDQRTDPRIDFVGGIRGMGELVKLVNEGSAVAAISIYPVSMDQLFAVADSGNVMPPKSTWFEPKLRDGLLTHLIYDTI